MLQETFARLDSRFDRLSKLYTDQYVKIGTAGVEYNHRLHAFEGLLSSAWQTWCAFCRDTMYKSLTGTTTITGTITQANVAIYSYGRMAYVAKQVSTGGVIKPGKELQLHTEPTWGDQKILLDLVQHLNPTNEMSLKSGLMLTYPASQHMRIVRNSVAHLSSNGFNDVKKLLIHYYGSSLRHPLDILVWQELTSREPVFLAWLSDLKEIAENMCQ